MEPLKGKHDNIKSMAVPALGGSCESSSNKGFGGIGTMACGIIGDDRIMCIKERSDAYDTSISGIKKALQRGIAIKPPGRIAHRMHIPSIPSEYASMTPIGHTKLAIITPSCLPNPTCDTSMIAGKQVSALRAAHEQPLEWPIRQYNILPLSDR